MLAGIVHGVVVQITAKSFELSTPSGPNPFTSNAGNFT